MLKQQKNDYQSQFLLNKSVIAGDRKEEREREWFVGISQHSIMYQKHAMINFFE